MYVYICICIYIKLHKLYILSKLLERIFPIRQKQTGSRHLREKLDQLTEYRQS